METPLTPSRGTRMYPDTPQSASRFKYQATVENHDETTANIFYEAEESFEPSSPFLDEINSTQRIKSRSNSPVKGRTMTPVKSRDKSRSPSKHRSPRKPLGEFSPAKQLTESALRENEGLTKTIDMTQTEDKENVLPTTPRSSKSSKLFDDDTCISAFSEIPTDMTRFVRLGGSPIRESPSKSGQPSNGNHTPRTSRPTTPATINARHHQRDVSPTPRRNDGLVRNAQDQTTQLLEFTGALDYATARCSPTRTAHRLRSPTKDGFAAASPSEARKYANLLDFDLPPAPTPRSALTISVREMEAVKAEFLSQISTLKTSMSSKDDELQSLLQAKQEAEHRCGQMSEQIMNLTTTKQTLETTVASLDARDQEMKAVLTEVREEIILREKEQKEVEQKADEALYRAEEAEARAVDAENKLKALEEEHAQVQQAAEINMDNPPSTPITNKTIEAACARVAKDLHDLYKEKHNKKIDSLRKTYQDRWQSKVSSLQAQLDKMIKENEDLKTELKAGRDSTLTRPVFNAGLTDVSDAGTVMTPQKPSDAQPQSKEANAATQAQIADLGSQLQILKTELDSAKEQNTALRKELEMSRVENGELVAAVEQMLSLDPGAMEGGVNLGASISSATGSMYADAPSYEAPVSRPGSSLSRPGSSLGRPGAMHERTGSQDGASSRLGPGKSGLKAPGSLGGSGFGFKRSNSSAPPSRLGLMSSIERMGRGAGSGAASRE